MSSSEELIAQFGNAIKPTDIMTEALSICRIYSLTGEDLKYKWDAFAFQMMNLPGTMTKREEPTFDLENLRELRKDIQSSVKPVKLEAGTPAQAPRNALRKSLGRGGIDGLLDGLSTPAAKKRQMGSPSIAMGTPASASKSFATPRPSNLSASTSRDIHMTTPDRAEQLSPSGSKTPTNGATSPSRSLFTTPAPSKFETRTNALSIVESLNAHLDLPNPTSSLNPRVKLGSNTNPASYKYRYMFEKLLDRSEALDTRIDEGAELIRSYHEVDEEFGDPGVDSQEDMVCVGRICTDLYAAKLQDGSDKSKTSVWLESSRLMGAGARIELRFDDEVKIRGHEAGDGGAGMFPGAIIGVRGRNVGGQFFNVTEILMMPPMELPASLPKDLMEYHHSDMKLGGRALSVMIACGPYTTDDNLDYIPFEALINEARKTKPDTIILVGPFVDANHPAIRSGDISYAPPQIFQMQISARLQNLVESSPGTNIILIPSGRDVLSPHVVYPQAPLERDVEMNLTKRAKLLPNPANFSINEVNFAISSADVLFPLRSQEYVREGPSAIAEEAALHEGAPRDHIARVCRHILRQRSFYPIFPPPLSGAGVEAINLDVTHMDLLKFDSFGADVVIMPSMLGKHFIKVVDSTIVVNPSYLTRGPNGGTYARFSIHPISKDELRTELSKAAMSAEQHATENKVYERCRVDIVRI